MKKFIALLTSVLLLTSLTGCSSNNTQAPDESSKTDNEVKLTFMTNVVGEQADALQKAIKGFEEETGYVVEFTAPGKSYEELMKTKMSSNSLPDLFTTHGWSVARYSEYLEPVNDMEFAGRISDQMKSVITNKDGQMFVLPIDSDVAGMVYNVTVLEKAGVNPDDIKTWADFETAAEKIKAAGYEVITIGGKDSWTIGQFFDWVAPSFYVTDEANNQREALKSGDFSEEIWVQAATLMDNWTKAGYFNEDVLTSDYMGDCEALAKDEAAFAFYGNSTIVDAKKVNPDVKLGMMPIPSNSENDEPSLIAGERIAVGAWKDSPYKAQAIELMNYLARPEVASEICLSSGNPSGLVDVDVELGEIKDYYKKYETVRTFPYFDREYLPSGMWDVMCSTGADILAGKEQSVTDAAKAMKLNFDDKFAQ